jgi:hypothetical protein
MFPLKSSLSSTWRLLKRSSFLRRYRPFAQHPDRNPWYKSLLLMMLVTQEESEQYNPDLSLLRPTGLMFNGLLIDDNCNDWKLEDSSVKQPQFGTETHLGVSEIGSYQQRKIARVDARPLDRFLTILRFMGILPVRQASCGQNRTDSDVVDLADVPLAASL